MPDQTTTPVSTTTPSAESASVRTVLVIPVEVAGPLAVSVAVADHLDRTETLTVTASDGAA